MGNGKREQAWELCKAHARSWDSRYQLGADIPLPLLASPSLSGEPADMTEHEILLPIHQRKTKPLRQEELPVHLQDTKPLPRVQDAARTVEQWDSIKAEIMELIDTKPTPVVTPRITLTQRPGA